MARSNASQAAETLQRLRYLAESRKQPLRGLVAEVELARVLRAEVRDAEPDLAQTCWVEYAFMTPFQRTEAFVREYARQWVRYYEKFIDVHAAKETRPIKERLIANGRGEFASLWAARQAADEHGVAYPEFISAAMDAANRLGFKRIPRPNQLYSTKLLSSALDAWEEAVEAKELFRDDWDARFFADAPDSAPRRRARQLAIDRVKRKPRSHWDLSLRSLLQRGVFTETEARSEFGDDPVDAALSTGAGYRPATALVQEHATPGLSCLGYLRDESRPCSKCAYRAACRELKSKVDARLIAAHGEADLHRLRVRASNRERKRRQRLRERSRSAA